MPPAWQAALWEQMAQGLLLVDMAGQVREANPAAAQMLGRSVTKLVGQDIEQVFVLAEAGILAEQLPRPGNQATLALRKPGGELFWLEISAHRFQPEPAALPLTALLLRDVSGQESSRNLGSYFLANISHEFRTPISALNASVELLLEELENLSLAEISQLLNSIHLSVTGLQTLIDNLLESTLMAAGHFHIRRRRADLGQIVRAAIQVMQPLLDRRHQELQIWHDPELPTNLSADPTRLQQVLVNLLSNASKYSPMESQLGLALQRQGEELLVQVRDQGPGLPSDQRDQIFQRFIRLSNQDGTQPGVGLGLSVVRTVVEEHGGRVGVEDRPDRGAIFWFSIPLEVKP